VKTPKHKRNKVNKKGKRQAPALKSHPAQTNISNGKPHWSLKALFSGWGAFVVVVTILGAITTAFCFKPKISVTPGEPSEHGDPFNTPFFLENDGYFAIYSIKKELKTFDVVTPYTSFKNGSLGDNSEAWPLLESGRKTTILIPSPYQLGLVPQIPEGSIESAHLDLQVSFRPAFYPWRVTNVFSFKTVKNSSKELVWVPFEYNFSITNGALKVAPISN
jgi:hypothetical protein